MRYTHTNNKRNDTTCKEKENITKIESSTFEYVGIYKVYC